MSEIIKLPIEEEVKSAYLDYAMSVIVGRAIPDVKDGLKPVQRRILYTMYEERMFPNTAFKKSARTVGTVIAKYHPHGDSAVYEALVRMAQDFVMRYPLIQGQGNFGSIDGDAPAAMRYCVVGDTLINTDMGILKIEDLVPNSEENSDNPINIKVQSLNGNINSSDMFFNSGKHKTLKIKTREGFEIEGSYNHPVLVFSYINGKPMYIWKTLDRIEKGDYLVINTRNKIDSEIDYITEEEAILLGSFLAEKELKHGFKNKIVSNRVVKVSRNLICEEIMPGVYDDKEIPSEILQSSRSVQRAFLRSLFEVDGIVDIKNLSLEITSSSSTFIKQLQILLLNFEILSEVEESKSVTTLRIKDTYSLFKFLQNIGFISQDKENSLLIVINETDFYYKIPHIRRWLKENYPALKLEINSYNYIERYIYEIKGILSEDDFQFIEELLKNRYFFSPVVSIEEGGEKNVYSIRVNSKCHSFVGNGIINHNTEARLTKIAMEMLADIEKDTVNMRDNFDGTTKEPEVLPAKFPNLICNGATGIAVGLSTNIPPHNFSEVAEALKYLAEFPEATVEELTQFIKAPDFPTGGIITTPTEEIVNIYKEGRGSIKLKGKARIERLAGNRHRIVIYEIPYQVNKSELIKKIAELVKKGREKGISDLRDETDRTGIRIIVELKREADPEKVLKRLYRYTPLEKSIPINLTVLVDKQPKTLDLKSLLYEFIKHRLEVITRRIKYELRKAEDEFHKIEGLLKALDRAEEVIETIKSSQSTAIAKENLKEKFDISDAQAQHILDMRLARFTSIEGQKLKDRKEELSKMINRYKDILSSEEEKVKVFISEMDELLEKFGDERKSLVIPKKKNDLTFEENFILAVFNSGRVINKRYIKEEEKAEIYKKVVFQVINENKPLEILISLQEVKSTTPIAFFTKDGYAYWSLVADLPKGEGKFNVDDREVVGTSFKGEGDEDRVFLLTKKGIIKRMSYEDIFFKSQRHKVFPLADGDELVTAFSDDNPSLLGIYTKNGDLLVFERNQVRITGDKAKGVEAIDLDEGDEVKGGFIMDSEPYILIITERGYSKLVKKEEFFTKDGKPKKRGQKGLMAVRLNKDDKLAVALPVKEGDTIFLSTEKGRILKLPVDTKRIPITKRTNLGEPIFKDGDRIVRGVKPKVRINEEN